MNLVIWRDFVWLFGFFSVQLLESSLCVFLKKQYK